MCNRLPEINKNGDAGIFPVYYSLKICNYYRIPLDSSCNRSIVREKETNLYVRYCRTVQQYKGSRKNTTPFKTSIILHYLYMLGRPVLAPAAHLMYRKTWILSTPDRTRHQATPWISLPSSSSPHGVPRHPFIPAASIATCRLLSSQPGFGEIAINRNTYDVTNHLYLSWKMMFQVLRLPKTLQPWIQSGVQTKTFS